MNRYASPQRRDLPNRPTAMSFGEPGPEDNMRQVLTKHNRLYTLQCYEYRLFVIACCWSEEEGSEDLNVLLEGGIQSRASLHTWRLPEIDLTKLPGSGGINDSVKRIAVEYCRRVFVENSGVVKVLIATKANTPTRVRSQPSRRSSRTLKVYVVVAFAEPPQFKVVKGGEVVGMKPLAWLWRNEKRYAGGKSELAVLASAVECADEYDQEALVMNV